MKNRLAVALAASLIVSSALITTAPALSAPANSSVADSSVANSSLVRQVATSRIADKNLLPSWSEGKTRDRIITFVEDVINPESKQFVPVEDRFATFDNDGTILCEKPAYFEVIYTRDRARQVQDKHPEWASDPLVQKFLKSSDDDLLDTHTSESMQIMAQTAGDNSLEELHAPEYKWLDTAVHPRFGKLFKKLHYQPMLELVKYLQDSKFKVYLCSGGQAEFMRCYAQEEYGIGSSQVMGSSLELEYTQKDGRSEIVTRPKMQLFNINGNKAISISQHIGKRPVIACGNSDGDTAMLTYAGDRQGPSLSILIHHDDGKREYAYDKGAEKVLPVAAQKGWLVVSMKDDFKKVFDFDN